MAKLSDSEFKELIIDKFSLSDKTVLQMDSSIAPTGLRSRNIWDQIRAEKLVIEQAAERLSFFQARLLKPYTADDLESINGVVGFKQSAELDNDSI
jgi:hypothetical protein